MPSPPMSPRSLAVTRAALAASPDGVLVERPGTGRLTKRGTHALEPNGYAHRLVVSRKLYDGAVGTQLSPSLAGLAPGAAIHLHPLDLDRLGASAGTPLRVSGTNGAVVLDAVPDTGVPRGAAWVAFNQPNVDIGDLLDTDDAVTDVVIESIGADAR